MFKDMVVLSGVLARVIVHRVGPVRYQTLMTVQNHEVCDHFSP